MSRHGADSVIQKVQGLIPTSSTYFFIFCNKHCLYSTFTLGFHFASFRIITKSPAYDILADILSCCCSIVSLRLHCISLHLVLSFGPFETQPVPLNPFLEMIDFNFVGSIFAPRSASKRSPYV